MARLTHRLAVRQLVAGSALALAGPLVAPLGAQLASQRAIPSTYAITNARLVPVAGPAIEKGTIVVRDGLIAAVGATVRPPADARVIDGTGLTVYPGLIDAYSSVGMTAAGGQARGAAGGGGAPAAMLAALGGGQPQANAAGARNSNYPAGLQPEVTAVGELKVDAETFAGPQSAGITAALTAPSSGIFQGQSAFVTLGSGDATSLVVKAPVSQNVGFTPLRNGGYPNSLMGVFASLRQMLLDAQHYRDEQRAYGTNPRGMRRPEYDASLEALVPVVNGTQPVIMQASTKREIERALALAKEFGLKLVVAGGSEAYEVADQLKAANVPVLLSLNFPRRAAAASADADPDPVRLLRERVQAPKTPGQLAKAGVTFAFESGGLSTWSDFLGNAQRAVEDGTLRRPGAPRHDVGQRRDPRRRGPRRVDRSRQDREPHDQRGDLPGRGGRVTQLFIDGRPVTPRAPAADAAGANAAGDGERHLDDEHRARRLAVRGDADAAAGRRAAHRLVPGRARHERDQERLGRHRRRVPLHGDRDDEGRERGGDVHRHHRRERAPRPPADRRAGSGELQRHAPERSRWRRPDAAPADAGAVTSHDPVPNGGVFSTAGTDGTKRVPCSCSSPVPSVPSVEHSLNSVRLP